MVVLGAVLMSASTIIVAINAVAPAPRMTLVRVAARQERYGKKDAAGAAWDAPRRTRRSTLSSIHFQSAASRAWPCQSAQVGYDGVALRDAPSSSPRLCASV